MGYYNCNCGNYYNGKYPDKDTCLCRYKKLVEEQTFSETHRLFDETIDSFRESLNLYREAIQSRDRDLAISKQIAKQVDCLEYYKAFNFACPRCKCINSKARQQVRNIVDVEDNGLSSAEQAFKCLIDSRLIDDKIQDLNARYADCVNIQDKCPKPYCNYDCCSCDCCQCNCYCNPCWSDHSEWCEDDWAVEY